MKRDAMMLNDLQQPNCLIAITFVMSLKRMKNIFRKMKTKFYITGAAAQWYSQRISVLIVAQ